MKRQLVSFIAGALAPVAIASIYIAPAQQAAQSPGVAPVRPNETPKNIKVLSKDLTVRQIREIMDGWTDDLNAECSTCHVRDPKDIGPNGRPRFNYADDAKQEKRTARVMYAMTDAINSQFVAKVPNSGVPVTCGTCHRGHLSPAPFSGGDDGSSAQQSAPAGK